MKKMFVLWGALALLTAACSNEESQKVAYTPLVLTAQQEGGEATRTSLSGREVRWSAGDNVAAFVSNVAHTSTATEILSAKSARFTFSDLAADAVVQYAVYPAAAAAERLAGDVITVTVPTEQTAVAGSFAEGSAVAIAKGGSSTLEFKNVCGFLAFTINADDVQSVHIYANEKMTGAADVIWNSGNPTVSAFKTFAYTGVKLTGPFTKGATYYAAVFPGTYKGLTLKLTHSNGYVSTYTNSNTLTISQADNEFVERLQRVVSEHLSDKDFDITLLASEMCMSRTSLNRKMRGVFNLTPNNYIKVERLKRAAQLLKMGDSKVSEVCYIVGFNSPSYFSQCFYKQFGLLPKDFVSEE